MPPLRSRTVTHGKNMAGARALLRATGVARQDIGKPIIAVANSFTEFVPGHVHLREVGQVVSDAIRAAGAVPREFNTIAVDDGIAMGHGGMLYSLPSRELIADSVEYLVNAHCADAMICIPRRELRLDVPDAELAARRDRGRSALGSYRPARRQRPVSVALQVYAAMATSAATGTARHITLIAHPDELARPGELAHPDELARPGELAHPDELARPGELALPDK